MININRFLLITVISPFSGFDASVNQISPGKRATTAVMPEICANGCLMDALRLILACGFSDFFRLPDLLIIKSGGRPVRVVYIDSLFLINLIVNSLLLMAVSRICAIGAKKIRIISGALLGAVYAVITVFPGFIFLQNFLIRLSVGLLMLLCAFGGQRGFLRITLVFLAVTAAFGGVVMAVALLGGEIWTGAGVYLPISFRALALSFGLSYGLLVLVFRFIVPRRGKGGYAHVSIRRGGREVSFLALRDTGNSVRDPLTGIPVPVVDLDCVRGLFSGQSAELLANSEGGKAAELLERIWELDPGLRLRLIPYSTVGIKSDMLLAFKPDEIKVDQKPMKGMWVAISPTKISENGVFSALINGDV